MVKHLVLVTDLELQNIISGKQKYFIRFFRKTPEFLKNINLGDTIFFRKRKGEVLGQFEIGKLIFIDRFDEGDWNMIWGVKKEEFEEKLQEYNTLIVVQIRNLEQLITSPVEIDKRNKKEWLVLE